MPYIWKILCCRDCVEQHGHSTGGAADCPTAKARRKVLPSVCIFVCVRLQIFDTDILQAWVTTHALARLFANVYQNLCAMQHFRLFSVTTPQQNAALLSFSSIFRITSSMRPIIREYSEAKVMKLDWILMTAEHIYPESKDCSICAA